MDVQRAVEEAARDFVRTQRVGETCFINLPLIYPDGSYVTVRVDQAPGGLRVSDNGFAFREAEDVEAQKGSFKRAAKLVAERAGVLFNDHAIYVEASLDTLESAVCEVAEASWRVADRICQRAFDDDEQAISDALIDRLLRVFGPQSVDRSRTSLMGASTNEWSMSAVVRLPNSVAVFQAVSEHSSSIYKASTAFRDLAELGTPPRLIAVVEDIQLIGKKATLLNPAKIVEMRQSDKFYWMAAA